MKSSSRIRRLADDLLARFKVTAPPVPVDRIAVGLGLHLKYVSSEDPRWSGMLYRRGRIAIIAINRGHLETRQRFTIAHELGHYLLSDNKSAVFVDTAIVRFRNTESSLGIDPDEIRANQFAAELLMPRDFLLQDIDETQDVEDAIPDLARRYKVSEQAMTFRLVNLGFIT